jgi:hypothetical protein
MPVAFFQELIPMIDRTSFRGHWGSMKSSWLHIVIAVLSVTAALSGCGARQPPTQPPPLNIPLLETVNRDRVCLYGLSLSSDGRLLACGNLCNLAGDPDNGDVITIWDTASGKERELNHVGWGTYALAFAPDSKSLICADPEGRNLLSFDTSTWAKRTLTEAPFPKFTG